MLLQNKISAGQISSKARVRRQEIASMPSAPYVVRGFASQCSHPLPPNIHLATTLNSGQNYIKMKIAPTARWTYTPICPRRTKLAIKSAFRRVNMF